ncbi:unnamed protein product, partial [Prorocentrum cordatum]
TRRCPRPSGGATRPSCRRPRPQRRRAGCCGPRWERSEEPRSRLAGRGPERGLGERAAAGRGERGLSLPRAGPEPGGALPGKANVLAADASPGFFVAAGFESHPESEAPVRARSAARPPAWRDLMQSR